MSAFTIIEICLTGHTGLRKRDWLDVDLSPLDKGV
jgi:hypothetical protein